MKHMFHKKVKWKRLLLFNRRWSKNVMNDGKCKKTAYEQGASKEQH